MKAEIVKPFAYAHDGIRIEEIQVGAIVEGDCAVQALAGGWGRAVDEERAAKAVDCAPANKARQAAPRNKGRSS
jgi:hypothetical protein